MSEDRQEISRKAAEDAKEEEGKSRRKMKTRRGI
jgi:hypothetical protein